MKTLLPGDTTTNVNTGARPAGQNPPAVMPALSALAGKFDGARTAKAPRVESFRAYLEQCARVPLRGGSYAAFRFEGRQPLQHIVELIDLVLRNILGGESVVIHGHTFKPGTLKGAIITVGGGAQFGKTILVLNLQGYLTAIVMVNVGYYVPDQELLAKIVDTKFRPDVLDQQPWMARMIEVGKAENDSGKAVNRKTSYQVSDGNRKAFGHFCGMHKPPTTISLDVAVLDEVDDIPDKNMGYVSGRMTGSPLATKLEIGTQRVFGAGQHKRVEAGTLDRYLVACAGCGAEWNLEENFPRIIRVAVDGPPQATDPSITPERGHDRDTYYYCACPDCGQPLDRDAGAYKPMHPERAKQGHFSVRVSQLAISAITLQEIVGAWYAALADPSGQAIVAFYCDRIAIPNAGAAQPITPKVLDRARGRGYLDARGAPYRPWEYAMSLSRGTAPRFAGLDMGPRCWLWVDEAADEFSSACVWAELMASDNAPTRLPLLMDALGIACVFLDAGGEPDLTKRLVLALNGLEDYQPLAIPQAELIRSQFSTGNGPQWDGQRGRWLGIRAAAVLFSSREAKGVEQTIGFTQSGKIYPLIKCNRAESIQTAVNDFLTPPEGVVELVKTDAGQRVREYPRARLPDTYIGAGVSQAVLDGHLLNLRKITDPRTGAEDWAEKIENHLGLAKVYARLAQMVGGTQEAIYSGSFAAVGNSRFGQVNAWRRNRSVEG